MQKLFLKIALFFVFVQFSVAGTGKITGTVQDTDSKKYLADVIVKIQGTDISDKTDEGGAFLLNHLDAGKYYLVLIKSGYYSLVIPDVIVKDDDPVLIKAEMYPGDEKQFLFLEIGGIQVTADRELLSEEAQTVHKISAGEIEHMQANSLADVLDMIPGNEKTGNLGLSKKQEISLRTLNDPIKDTGALFGTKVIVDDVPLTNNADLQSGVGVGYGQTVQTTAGRQYDLREVVAENIEKVEVQSGASSVEYGDHTAGVIIVKTKSSNVPTRLKIKHNPDTQEANLMGSLGLFNTNLVYNFNYGYSERAIRIKGDEYHRISGSLKSSNLFLDEKLALKQNLKYNRKLEEDNDDSDPYGVKAYNRDHHLTYSQQFDYQYNAVSSMYLRNYVDYKRRNSWLHKQERNSPGYQTDRLIEGSQLAVAIDPIYFSDVRTIGDEWSYGSKFKWNRKFFTGDILHRFLTGAEFQTEKNTGQGKSFDMLKPPGGRVNTRPRSFSDVPGTTQFALFWEDRITGELLFPFTLNFGFRVDSYNPTSFKIGNLFNGKDVFASEQGTFFNPRFGLKIKPFSKTQLRLSYGKSSKTPSLSMVYPEPYYLDVFHDTKITIQVPDGNGGEKDTIINWKVASTNIYDRSVPNLKGYQTTKYELSLDQQIGPVGFTFTGYYKKAKNAPRSLDIPHSYILYDWPNWPDTTGRKVTENVLIGRSSYDKGLNLRHTQTNGFEFSLRTHRIPSLNMRFRINAAFNFSKYTTNDYRNYGSARKYTEGDTVESSGWAPPRDMEIIPYYKPTSSWRQRAVINYSVDYIAKPLGIWFTLKAQQVLWDQDLDYINPYLSAVGYFENGQNVEIDPETSRLMGLDKTYDPLKTTVDTSKPNDKWLFSIVASKSLFKGAEVSLFIENIFDDPAYYLNRYGSYYKRNPNMFWGIAFSSKLDDLFF